MMTDFRALCAELVDAWLKGDDIVGAMNRARAALAKADGPAVPEGREPAAVITEPSDEELLKLMPEQFRQDLATVSSMAAHGAGTGVTPGLFRVSLNTGALEYARAVLACWGNCKGSLTSSPPADGEVAELVEWLQEEADDYECIGCEDSAAKCKRVAELLERQAQQTLPQGLIPMEYVDADSSARIVSEPSEDGPGGCWVVRNSRHVNPCTEFPTAEAAWDALQRAQSLPSTVGPFDRIKFTCHLVPREQADG